MVPHNDYYRPAPDLGGLMNFTPSERDGVALCDLPVGAVLEVETVHHHYLIENRGDGKVLISGHPEYCPRPVLVDLLGSRGSHTPFKFGEICPGRRMEFVHPLRGVVLTSPITETRKVASVPRVGEQLARTAS